MLLNELGASAAEQVWLSFKSADGTVQLTKDSVISSSSSSTGALDTVSRVFGLSLHGALGAC